MVSKFHFISFFLICVRQKFSSYFYVFQIFDFILISTPLEFVVVQLFSLDFDFRFFFFKQAPFFLAGANISYRPQTFLSRRKHFSQAANISCRPQTFLSRRKHFPQAATFLFRRKGWAQTFLTGRKHFSAGANISQGPQTFSLGRKDLAQGFKVRLFFKAKYARSKAKF